MTMRYRTTRVDALAWLDPLFTVELRLRCVGIQFERILRSLITGNEIGRYEHRLPKLTLTASGLRLAVIRHSVASPHASAIIASTRCTRAGSR
jgi:hypothetical protein